MTASQDTTVSANGPTRILVHGITGRMGQRIADVAAQDPNCEVVGGVAQPGCPEIGQPLCKVVTHLAESPYAQVLIVDDIEAVPSENIDVIIDFSFAPAIGRVLDYAEKHSKPLVSGTTGLSEAQTERVGVLARTVPLLKSDNFSLGVNLLRKYLKEMSATLPSDYDIELVETHHRLKKDSPSGTAFALAHACREGRSLTPSCFVHGREGLVGERTNEEIGMHAVRGGSIIGDHSVSFTNMMEQITISHRALDRDVFASGAVRAGKWLAERVRCGHPKGSVYDMMDVLEI